MWPSLRANFFFFFSLELTCHNKWDPGILEISAPLEIAVGPHLYVQHNTKTTPVCTPLLLMEKPFGCYFQNQFPYYQAMQYNQKTTIPVSSRWQIRSEKVKKGLASTLITPTTSIHLPKSVSADLTIKSDVLTNPIGKDGVWVWSM